jgi:hypothetical protein
MGGYDWNTLILEREWESLAAMEAAYERAFADPEHRALGKELRSILKNLRREAYMPLP